MISFHKNDIFYYLYFKVLVLYFIIYTVLYRSNFEMVLRTALATTKTTTPTKLPFYLLIHYYTTIFSAEPIYFWIVNKIIKKTKSYLKIGYFTTRSYHPSPMGCFFIQHHWSFKTKSTVVDSNSVYILCTENIVYWKRWTQYKYLINIKLK